MVYKFPGKISYTYFFYFLSIFIFFTSCTTVRKYQKNKPFVYQNKINLTIDNVTPDEKVLIKSRLNTQLSDSSKVRIKDVVFVFHYIDRPPLFDTLEARASADNMITAMANLGFFKSKANYTYKFDTIKSKDQIRVTTIYNVEAGKRTLIDTLAYLLNKPELQHLALQTKSQSPLQKNTPVTKAGVQNETGRLVDLYRNNGYYKFTGDELRVTGDTTIEALTNVSDDPFEAVRLLAEANEKRNKPTIKLGIHLNNSDSTRLSKFYFNNIYILPDYKPGDLYTDSGLTENIRNDYIIRYHKKLFRNALLADNMFIKKGNIYRQDDYYKTLNSFYKLGAWESPGIDLIEKKDSNLLDVVVKLIPAKKYGFEGNVELSYSTNSSTSNSLSATNTGNLLGVAGNISLLNRNVGQQAIRFTNSLRVGVEFNTSRRNSNGTLINSNEFTYSNNILIPKFVTPFRYINKQKILKQQTFINTTISQINRIDFFNQQIFNVALGYNFTNKINRNWAVRPLNFDYRRLYNRSANFDATLLQNPFLRYSFNTALVMGSSLSFTSSYANVKHKKRQNIFKFNLEESGLFWGRLRDILTSAGHTNFLTKYLKEFIKTDADFVHTITHPKSAVVFRAFAGVGIPLSKRDTTLPFFKQYFGGGPNSMRGWPVRGIGVGGQPLIPYASSPNLFNDRTGDIQIEGNAEYRFNVAALFSNAVNLKMAFFTDVGNIWNFKNTKPDGSKDTTQFKFKNLYKQLGVSAGTGFRFDFNYFLIRFDAGLRLKRPDVSKNDGWQIPAVTFNHIFGNGYNDKKWRYENFNFTIGIDYPF